MAGAGTSMMGAFLCLLPWWDGQKVRLGWNDGTAFLPLPVVLEPFPLHMASPCGLSSTV